MIDEILKLKLDCSLFVNLVEQNNIYDAFFEYKKLKKILIDLKKTNEYSNVLINNELKLVKEIFCSILYEKGTSFFDDRDYSRACMCFSILIKLEDLSKDVMKKYIECLLALNQDILAQSFLSEYAENLSDDDLELHKTLSDLYERAKSYEDSVNHMQNYMNLTSEPTIQDYYDFGRKYLLFYDEKKRIEDVLESIKIFNTVLSINKNNSKNNIIQKIKDKVLSYIKTAESNQDKLIKINRLILICKKLANNGNVEKICKLVMEYFYEIGMLDEYAYCLELIARRKVNYKSYNNDENQIIDMIDRYRLISQIFVYFNMHKKFDEIIFCRKYIYAIKKTLEYLSKSTIRKYKDEILKINKYLSKNLSINDDSWDLNNFVLEIDDKCLIAYLNIIDTYINKKEYEKAYNFYNKFCDKFNEEKQPSVPYMLWQLGNIWISLNFYYKAMKLEKLAVDYELSNKENVK